MYSYPVAPIVMSVAGCRECPLSVLLPVVVHAYSPSCSPCPRDAVSAAVLHPHSCHSCSICVLIVLPFPAFLLCLDSFLLDVLTTLALCAATTTGGSTFNCPTIGVYPSQPCFSVPRLRFSVGTTIERPCLQCVRAYSCSICSCSCCCRQHPRRGSAADHLWHPVRRNPHGHGRRRALPRRHTGGRVRVLAAHVRCTALLCTVADALFFACALRL
jgi:hypothetical protein